MQPFAAEIGDVRSKEREHGLDRRIVQTLLHLRGELADGKTNTHSARGHEQELQARLGQRKGASHDGGDSETEGDKGSGVIYQA